MDISITKEFINWFDIEETINETSLLLTVHDCNLSVDSLLMKLFLDSLWHSSPCPKISCWDDMEVPEETFHWSSWDSRTCYPRRAFIQGLTDDCSSRPEAVGDRLTNKCSGITNESSRELQQPWIKERETSSTPRGDVHQVCFTSFTWCTSCFLSYHGWASRLLDSLVESWENLM